MILLLHKDEKVTKITDIESNQLIDLHVDNPIMSLFKLANEYPNRILVWCHESLQSNINFEVIKSAFKLKNTMLSFSDGQYLSEQIGYVEDSPFLKVNKEIKYPTWLVSSFVGAILSSQLLKFENQLNTNESFDFALNSISKLGLTNGLFCYSEPKLLNHFDGI
ncbi:MAG: hypothetical protein WBN21_02600, partial [Algibacter sp.]